MTYFKCNVKGDPASSFMLSSRNVFLHIYLCRNKYNFSLLFLTAAQESDTQDICFTRHREKGCGTYFKCTVNGERSYVSNKMYFETNWFKFFLLPFTYSNKNCLLTLHPPSCPPQEMYSHTIIYVSINISTSCYFFYSCLGEWLAQGYCKGCVIPVKCSETWVVWFKN